MAKKTVTWILVADATKAAVYGNDGPGCGIYRALEQDFALDLPSKVGDIVSDQQGRVVNTGGIGHHAVGPRSDPRRHLEAEFLRSVATVLEDAAIAKMYDRLVLAAGPKALGDLRKHLGAHATALLTKELAKDLVHLPEQELAEHLRAAEVIH